MSTSGLHGVRPTAVRQFLQCSKSVSRYRRRKTAIPGQSTADGSRAQSFKPHLHFDQSGGGAGWKSNAVVEGIFQECDDLEIVGFADFAAAKGFQLGAGFFPGLHPAPESLAIFHNLIIGRWPECDGGFGLSFAGVDTTWWGGDMGTEAYDPFVAGRRAVEVRSMERWDDARGRRFPIEMWIPAEGSKYPLVIFSHASGNHRRGASFLCTHLASHGYVVAAMDHSEVVAPELRFRTDENAADRRARMEAVISSRVPDTQFLMEQAIHEPEVDGHRIGIVGHSFGGWTALAMPDVEPRIGAVVALAPGGASNPRPGILPLKLAFAWRRDVPTLYLVAENDVALPLSGMHELFDRTPAAKRMVILRRADHMHFVDNVEEAHEGFRKMVVMEELAALQREMLPMAELCPAEPAHLFTRGLTLCHFDAVLKGSEAARELLAGDIGAELAARGVEAIAAGD